MTSEASDDASKMKARLPRWIGIGLFIYASVFALSAAKAFLVPVVLGFLLSMVFAPVRRFFERRGIKAWLSSMLIVLTLLALFAGLLAALAMPVSNWVANAPRIERQVQYKLHDISQSFNKVLRINNQIMSIAGAQQKDSKAQKVKVEKGNSVAVRAATVAPTLLTQFLFTFILLFFLLASGDMFYEKLVHVLPTLRDKRRAVRVVYNAERKLSRYLFTITTINFCLGVAVGLTMALFGMPSPVVFGVVAFLFNFIPYLGALVGIIAAAAVALVTFSWIGWPLIIAGTYLCLTTLEGQLITPYFVGRSLRLNTVVVFLTVSFWAWLWSAVGMIVALPLLVAVKTLCENIEEFENVGAFLSERHAEHEIDEAAKRQPPEPPPEQAPGQK